MLVIIPILTLINYAIYYIFKIDLYFISLLIKLDISEINKTTCDKRQFESHNIQSHTISLWESTWDYTISLYTILNVENSKKAHLSIFYEIFYKRFLFLITVF